MNELNVSNSNKPKNSYQIRINVIQLGYRFISKGSSSTIDHYHLLVFQPPMKSNFIGCEGSSGSYDMIDKGFEA